jgi:hypothetical protein
VAGRTFRSLTSRTTLINKQQLNLDELIAMSDYKPTGLSSLNMEHRHALSNPTQSTMASARMVSQTSVSAPAVRLYQQHLGLIEVD